MEYSKMSSSLSSQSADKGNRSVGSYVSWFLLNPRTERAIRFISMLPIACWFTFGTPFNTNMRFICVIIYSLIMALLPPTAAVIPLIWTVLGGFGIVIGMAMSIWEFPVMAAEGRMSGDMADVSMFLVWVAWLSFFSVLKLGPLASLNVVGLFLIFYGSELFVFDSYLIVKNGVTITVSLADMSVAVDAVYAFIATLPEKIGKVVNFLFTRRLEEIRAMIADDSIPVKTFVIPDNITNVDGSLWPMAGVEMTVSVTHEKGMVISIPGGRWVTKLAIWATHDYGIVWSLFIMCFLAICFAYVTVLLPPVRFQRSFLRSCQVSLAEQLKHRSFFLANAMDLLTVEDLTDEGIPWLDDKPINKMSSEEFSQSVNKQLDVMAPPLLLSFFEALLFSPIGVCTFSCAPKILRALKYLGLHISIFEDFNCRLFETEDMESPGRLGVGAESEGLSQEGTESVLNNKNETIGKVLKMMDSISVRDARSVTVVESDPQRKTPSVDATCTGAIHDDWARISAEPLEEFLRLTVVDSLRVLGAAQTGLGLKPAVNQGQSQTTMMLRMLETLKYETRRLAIRRNLFETKVGGDALRKLVEFHGAELHRGKLGPGSVAADHVNINRSGVLESESVTQKTVEAIQKTEDGSLEFLNALSDEARPFDMYTWCVRFSLTFIRSPLELADAVTEQLNAQTQRSFRQFLLAVVGFITPLFIFLAGFIRPYVDGIIWIIRRIMPNQVSTRPYSRGYIGKWLELEAEYGRGKSNVNNTARPRSTWQSRTRYMQSAEAGETIEAIAERKGSRTDSAKTGPAETGSVRPMDISAPNPAADKLQEVVLMEVDFERRSSKAEVLRQLVPYDEADVVSRQEHHGIMKHYNVWSCVRFSIGNAILIALPIFWDAYRTMNLTDHPSNEEQKLYPDRGINMTDLIATKTSGWALLGFLVTYNFTAQGTAKKGVLRLIGITFGVLAAFLALTWFPTNPYLLCLWMCICDFAVVWATADKTYPLNGFNQSWGYAAQVFIYGQAVVISESFAGQAGRDEICADRLLGHLIGISTAVIVSFLVVPLEAGSGMRLHISDSIHCLSESFLAFSEIILPSIDLFCRQCAASGRSELKALIRKNKKEKKTKHDELNEALDDHECPRESHKKAWLDYASYMSKRTGYHIGQLILIIKDASIFIELPWLKPSANLLQMKSVIDRINSFRTEAHELILLVDEQTAYLYLCSLKQSIDDKRVPYISVATAEFPKGDEDSQSRGNRPLDTVMEHEAEHGFLRTLVSADDRVAELDSFWSDDESLVANSSLDRLDYQAIAINNRPGDNILREYSHASSPPKLSSASRKVDAQKEQPQRFFDLRSGAGSSASSVADPRRDPATSGIQDVSSASMKSSVTPRKSEKAAEPPPITELSYIEYIQPDPPVVQMPTSRRVQKTDSIPNIVVQSKEVVLSSPSKSDSPPPLSDFEKKKRKILTSKPARSRLIMQICVMSREVIVVLRKLSVLYGWTLDNMGGRHYWCLPPKYAYGKEVLTKEVFQKWVEDALSYCVSTLRVVGNLSAAGIAVFCPEITDWPEEKQTGPPSSARNKNNSPTDGNAGAHRPAFRAEIAEAEFYENVLSFRRMHLFAHFCVQEVLEYRTLGALIEKEIWK